MFALRLPLFPVSLVLAAVLSSAAVVCTSAPAAARPATVAVFEAKVREAPRDDAKVLAVLVEGASVSVDESSTDGWRRVRLEDGKSTGWIRDVDLGLAAPSTPVPTPSGAHFLVATETPLRDAPLDTAAVIRMLEPGTPLSRRGIPSNGFTPVLTVDGLAGHVASATIRVVSDVPGTSAPGAFVETALKVRRDDTSLMDSASPYGREIARLAAGTWVAQLAVPSTGLVKVRTVDGRTGYLAVADVDGVAPEVAPPAPAPAPVVAASPAPRAVEREAPAPPTVMRARRFSDGGDLVDFALDGPRVPESARSVDTRTTFATGLVIGSIGVALLSSIPLVASSTSEDGTVSDTDMGILIAGATIGIIGALVSVAVRPGDGDYHRVADDFNHLNPTKPIEYAPPTRVNVNVSTGRY